MISTLCMIRGSIQRTTDCTSVRPTVSDPCDSPVFCPVPTVTDLGSDWKKPHPNIIYTHVNKRDERHKENDAGSSLPSRV